MDDPAPATSVAEVYDLGSATGPLTFVASGAMGEIYRLQTTGGRYAVKLLFDWVVAHPTPADVAFQLKAAAAGVPLPRPVTAPDGQAVSEVCGRRLRVYEWADVSEHVQPLGVGTVAEAGRLLGTLHHIGEPTDEPVDAWYLSAPTTTQWHELAHSARLTGRPWAGPLSTQAARLGELGRLLEGAPPKPTIVCHRDFQPENVLPAGSGGLMVLDWENAGPMAPARELAAALLLWTCDGTGASPDAVRAFLGGYRSATGKEELGIEMVADFSVAFATMLNFLHAMASTAMASRGDERFAEAQVETLLASPLDELEHTAGAVLEVVLSLDP